ncbi:hypothetical protein D3C81_1899020 [compost metagenome]
MLLQMPADIRRIIASNLNIGAEHCHLVLRLRFQYITGMTGIWVKQLAGQHAADLELRIDLPAPLNRKRTGYELVMQSLKSNLLLI